MNYFVTVRGGSLCATNVALWTEDLQNGCDVGFELNSCVAWFVGLTQETAHLDHTLNTNNPPADHSEVTVINSRIRASRADYGNCIRTYTNAKLVVTNCYLYRGTGSVESAVSPTRAFMHNAVSVNGYSNQVIIAGNTVDHLPWGLACYGSIGGNHILIESNNIRNSLYGGLWFDWMWYSGVDLGGGDCGSRGGNVFSQAPSPGSNFCADVLYMNTSGYHPLANIFALRNIWSNATNRETVIYDKLDNPDYGRCLTEELVVRIAGPDADGCPVIAWNDRQAGEQYAVQICSDLSAAAWTNAPGSWPVVNPGTGDMYWTNTAPFPVRGFYRIQSRFQ